ncbi:WG repeat-containing protein [Muribaculaceae bacterium Isolate-002 (NCI)]|nr:WG repeat-containing protein [Muribaculaceae bacterium Isolate-002 (NCI)]
MICTENQYPNISQTEYRPFQYDNGDDYISDGRFRIVDKEGKIGYATEGGAVIITPRYAFGYPFSNGKAKVTDEGHLAEVEGSNGEYHYWESNNWCWIDKMGNIIR